MSTGSGVSVKGRVAAVVIIRPSCMPTASASSVGVANSVDEEDEDDDAAGGEEEEKDTDAGLERAWCAAADEEEGDDAADVDVAARSAT